MNKEIKEWIIAGVIVIIVVVISVRVAFIVGRLHKWLTWEYYGVTIHETDGSAYRYIIVYAENPLKVMRNVDRDTETESVSNIIEI